MAAFTEKVCTKISNYELTTFEKIPIIFNLLIQREKVIQKCIYYTL